TNLNFVRSLENVTSASRQLGYAEKASRDLAKGNVSFAEAAASIQQQKARQTASRLEKTVIQGKTAAPKLAPKPTGKRLAPEPSATKAEFTHKDKSQRTTTTDSPNGGSSSNHTTEGLIPPSHQLEFHGVYESFQSRALQLQQNRIEGRGFQGSVLEWLRITENKTSHTVFVQGKGHVTTIPDLPIEWGVSEIKNVKYISFTKQLQAQAALAKEKVTSFNLIISPRTEKISKQLAKEIRLSEGGGGKIFEFNPATQTMIERFLDGNKVLR
ncbi:MAG: putative toxin, partial [Candidatus Nucleicultricaceae bacterium]